MAEDKKFSYEDTWRIAIDITYRCKHRCRHCCVESTPDGPSMPFDTFMGLLSQIKGLGETYGITLTGGNIFEYRSGENDFSDVVGSLFTMPEARDYFRGLQFFIAPFGEEDTERATEVLGFLAQLGFFKIRFANIYLAYNLYSENINQRLLHTLPVLFQWIDDLVLTVTIDQGNDRETGQKLWITLQKIGFAPSREFDLLGVVMDEEFSLGKPPLSFERKGQPKKVITLHINPTLRAGRAKEWKNTYTVLGKSDCLVFGDKQGKIAYITLNGNILPCYSTFPDLSPMGNIFKEPLKDILARRERYKDQWMSHFLTHYRHQYGDFCTWCRKTFRFEP